MKNQKQYRKCKIVLYAPVIHKIRQLNCGRSLLNDIVAVKKREKIVEPIFEELQLHQNKCEMFSRRQAQTESVFRKIIIDSPRCTTKYLLQDTNNYCVQILHCRNTAVMYVKVINGTRRHGINESHFHCRGKAGMFTLKF